MNKSECFQVGTVVRTSGVQGEVVIHLDADDPSRYRSPDAVFLDAGGALVPFFVKRAKLNGAELKVLFDGYDSEESVKMLIRCGVWLPLEALPKLGEDRFYFHEINGFEVIDEVYGVTGIAEEVVDRLMQPVLRIMKEGQEVLVPLSAGVVQKVDRLNKKLFIKAPEGLIAIYLDGSEKD